MKDKIHAQWFENVTVTCSCGNNFITGSTTPEIKTEICSSCHPFFTGKEKLIDTEGRVEKFEKKRVVGERRRAEKASLDDTKKKDKDKKEFRPRSLKEMLEYASKQAGK